MIHVLLLTCAGLYGLRLLYFLSGFARGTRAKPCTEALPRVSVVVPARNEVANLERCIRSLAQSDYPAERLQIIVVNDRSTDGTAALLDDLAQRYAIITPIHRTSADDHPNLRGKPGALQAGIDRATGEILVMTDADCAVHPSWIRSMVMPFLTQNVDMVCSTTSVEPDGLFSRLQDVEWTYSHAMARASVQHGIPLGCYGNNLAIRASTYRTIGGYEAVRFSVTEDLALLQAVYAAGSHVAYLCQHDASVVTMPCTTVGEYLRQRQRWARGGTALGMKATAFVVSSMMLWLGIVVAAVTQDLGWFLGLAGMRIIGDASLVAWALLRLRRPSTIPWVIPSIIMLMLTELVVPFLLLQRDIVWKGQRFTH